MGPTGLDLCPLHRISPTPMETDDEGSTCNSQLTLMNLKRPPQTRSVGFPPSHPLPLLLFLLPLLPLLIRNSKKKKQQQQKQRLDILPVFDSGFYEQLIDLFHAIYTGVIRFRNACNVANNRKYRKSTRKIIFIFIFFFFFFFFLREELVWSHVGL